MKLLRHPLLVGPLLLLTSSAAVAGNNQWTGSGPLATGVDNRVINALTVSPDGTIYAGTGAGTVFAYTEVPSLSSQSIVGFTPPANLAVGGAAALSATATSGLAVTFSTLSTTCSVSGNTVTALHVGTCTVFADQAGNASYDPAPQETGNIVIGQAGQSVSFANPGNQLLGTSPTLSASATSGLPVSFSSSTAGVCTVTVGGALTLVSAGVCTVTANQAGDADHFAATGVTQSFSVLTTPLTTVSGNVGTGTITASLGGGGATCGFASYNFTATLPAAAPNGATFPHGLFDFTLSNCVGPVTLNLSYPTALPVGSHYWKYGPTTLGGASHWYVMPGAAVGGATATLTLTDGALGDDDMTANGTIVDAGGPGGGSGAVGVASVPTLSQWGLMLLSMLVGLLGLVRERRGPV
jgi:trimeric autotransporter adhesin